MRVLTFPRPFGALARTFSRLASKLRTVRGPARDAVCGQPRSAASANLRAGQYEEPRPFSPWNALVRW